MLCEKYEWLGGPLMNAGRISGFGLLGSSIEVSIVPVMHIREG